MSIVKNSIQMKLNLIEWSFTIVFPGFVHILFV